MEFEIVCPQGNQVRIDMANICAQNFKYIGVNAKISVKAEIDWDNQDNYFIGWGSPFDLDDHIYKVFRTEQNSNYSRYFNKEVDKILKEVRNIEDDNKRK